MKKLTDPITLGLAGLLCLFGALNFWKCQEAQAGGLQPPVPMYGDGVVRSMGVGPGGITTDGGINGLVTTTGTTTGRYLADRAADQGYNVKDFGAVCDGTVRDSDGLAIQAALDYAGQQDGGTVWLPVGNCNVGNAQPLWMKYSNVRLRGVGMYLSTITRNTSFAGPTIIISPPLANGGVTYGPPLPSGRYRVYVPDNDFIPLNGDPAFSMAGLATFAAGGHLMMADGGTGGGGGLHGILGSYGNLTTNSNGVGTDAGAAQNRYGAFSLRLVNGQLEATARIDGGLYTVTDPNMILPNVDYYPEVDYDGNRLMLYRDPGDGGNATVVAAVDAGPGGLTWSPWETVQFGANPRLALGNGMTTWNGPHAYVGEFGVWNHNLHDGGDFAVPAYSGMPGFSTGVLGAIAISWETDAGVPIVQGYKTVPSGAQPYYLYHQGGYPASDSNVSVSDMSVVTTGVGIYGIGMHHYSFENMYMSCYGECLFLDNNDYFGTIRHLYAGGVYRPVVRLQQAPNAITISDLEIQGGQVGLFTSGCGIDGTNITIYQSKLAGMWIQGNSVPGGTSTFGYAFTDEGSTPCPNYNLLAPLILDGVITATFSSTWLFQQCNTSPGIIFDELNSDNMPLGSLSGLEYHSYSSPAYNVFMGSFFPGQVECHNCWYPRDAGIPFAQGDAGVMIDDYRGTRTAVP